MAHSTENRIDTEGLLARMPLFEDLPHAHIVMLGEHSRGRRLLKGEMLFQKGDPAHGFFVVVYGQVKLAFPSSNGNEKVVDIIDAHQSFGEAVMLAQYVYPVFAQAILDTLLVFIPREAVFALLEEEPAFARRMLIGLAMHNHSLVHEIESYTLRTSTQRVIGYLLEHCPGDCGTHEAVEIHLPTSKQITASRLNLTPETLSRIFHDLMAARLIDMVGKRILIHSIQRLRDAITHDGTDDCLLASVSTRPRNGKPGNTRRRAEHAQTTDVPQEHHCSASW